MTKKRFIKLLRAKRANERALQEVVRFVQFWGGKLSYDMAYKCLLVVVVIAELPLCDFYRFCTAQIMNNWETWEY